MAYTRKTKLNLVRGDEKSLPVMDEIRKLVSGLEQEERETVLSETTEFYRARQSGMMSYLAMGEHLVKVREVLEPHQLWKKYANSLPNMGIAGVYRFIWRWENAQRLLPPATLRVAARDGFKLIDYVKDGGYKPEVEKAIKLVTKEMGPAPEKESEARAWLDAVNKTKRKLAKPINAQRTGIAGYARKVMAVVKRAITHLPEDKRSEFVDRVINELADIGKQKKGPYPAAA